jgi:hypothetical protein
MPYYSAPFTFNFTTSLIEVDPQVSDVDCIQLYQKIKFAQASQEGIIYGRIGEGSGLVSLGENVSVGLTIKLLGAWQIRFANGNYIARVAGGNLVGGPGEDPIAYSPGVQVLLIQSAASTVVVSESGGGGGGGGSPPTGARAVSIVVKSISGSPIENACVRLHRVGYSYPEKTNVLGIADFSVDDATYIVSITAAGHSFTPTNLTVNQNTTQEYSMPETTPPLPTQPGLCNVLFSVTHLGQPVEGAIVVAKIEDANPTVNGSFVSREGTYGITNENGVCVLSMIPFASFTRGGVYHIKVSDQNGRIMHDRRVTAPNQPTANAEDLLDAR